jgi:hypothetical protein
MAHAGKHDLALLQIITRDKMPAHTRLCEPKQVPTGKSFSALAVGCIGAGPPTLGTRTVLQSRRIHFGDQVDMLAWLVEIAQPEGYSGGPLFDPEGRLLGIASGTSGGRGYYCHVDEIRAFLIAQDLKWLVED